MLLTRVTTEQFVMNHFRDPDNTEIDVSEKRMSSEQPLVRHTRTDREVRILVVTGDQLASPLGVVPACPGAHIRHRSTEGIEAIPKFSSGDSWYFQQNLRSLRELLEKTDPQCDVLESRGAAHQVGLVAASAQLLDD